LAIYITGDTHGLYDVGKLSKITPLFNEGDFIIVLGDFGICWDNSESDSRVRNFWNKIKANVLFVDGNHENYTLLNRYPVSEKFGGKVQELDKRITHLMRGQIYQIGDYTFFTMGGAASHDCGEPMDAVISAHLSDYFTCDFTDEYDKLHQYQQRNCRTPGRSWWREEIPSSAEIAEAKSILAAHNNSTDYILTHAPSSRVYRHLGYDPLATPWAAPLIDFHNWAEDKVAFKHWYFGHMHMDFSYDDRHTGLYQQIIELS
jgi:predicted phosphodiesterase